MWRRAGEKITVRDGRLRRALEPYLAAQLESVTLVLEALSPSAAVPDFPFRFTGGLTEFARFVRAFFLTGMIVPVGGARMVDCLRYLMRLFRIPEPRNLSLVVYKLSLTEKQFRFLDRFRSLFEKAIFSGK